MKEFDLVDRARRALIASGFQPDFPPEVAEELKSVLTSPAPDLSLPDLRHFLWSSIDNEDSRDLDQIEYAEKAPNECIRLLIGIADVVTFVRKGGPIDARASQNTVSIYTAAKTFNLLPPELSNDRTSLLENSDHIAMVIDMMVQSNGEIASPQVYQARVRNRARLTYDNVEQFFEHDGQIDPAGDFPALREQLRLQSDAAQRLIELRKRTGALTFSSFEAKPVRRNGEVVDLVLIRHNRARDLIETFMIAANVATATFLKTHGWPIIDRVVRAPKRWDRIRQIAASYGTTLPAEAQP